MAKTSNNLGPVRSAQAFKRVQIAALLGLGVTYRNIAEQLSCSPTTVMAVAKRIKEGVELVAPRGCAVECLGFTPSHVQIWAMDSALRASRVLTFSTNVVCG